MTQSVDYLIVGGGVAGTTAAETIRGEDNNAHIVVLESDRFPLYSKVQLPSYIMGKRTRDQIMLRSFKDYIDRGIEFKIQKNVVGLDVSNKLVKTEDGEDYRYGKLLLTTGGKAKNLNKYPHEYLMQTLGDGDKIIESLKTAEAGLVVGSGFVALEFINVFSNANLKTSLNVSNKGFWGSFLSPEVSDCILRILESDGVEVTRGDSEKISSMAQDRKTLVGVGIGLDVEEVFFTQSGLKFDGGLVADSNLRLSTPDVFAAGDVVKFFSKKLQRQVKYGNWTNALTSGKSAGLNMLGKNMDFDVLSSYAMSCGSLNVIFLGFVGPDEQTKTEVKTYSTSECAQFFVRNGKLDGCVLINRNQDRSAYQSMIESRADFNLIQ